MVALAFAFVFGVAVSVYLFMRNRGHWQEMLWWHKWIVIMAFLNTVILGIALLAAISQNS